MPVGVVSYFGIQYLEQDKEGFTLLLGTEIVPAYAEALSARVEARAAELRSAAELAQAGHAAAARTLLASLPAVRAAEVVHEGRTTVRYGTVDAPPQSPPPGEGVRVSALPGTGLARLEVVAGKGWASAVVERSALRPRFESPTFETYVVDHAGRVLLHPDVAVEQRSPDRSALEPVQRLRQGQVGSARYTAEDGSERIAAYAPAAGGTGVVQVLPATAVGGAVRAFVLKAGGFAAVVVLLALLASLALAQAATRPLGLLADAARRIGQGHFDTEVPRARGAEMRALAEAFRAMQQGLKAREARIREAQEALIQTEKMSALGQLAAGITHEVKNPLAGIIGFAQLCQRISEAPPETPLGKNLRLIEQEGKRAKGILDNLLAFARPEAAERERLDPGRLLEEATALVAHQLRLGKVEVATEIEPHLPPILGNANQLKQVLMNLMLNARDAMQPKGGRLELRAVRGDDGRVVWEVKDEGHGIREEDQPKLFTPFFSTKEKGKGTGLGLSVSYGIVEAHGGEMRVWSQVGVGTVFFVYLPAAASSPGQDATSAARQGA
ncbi:MAG: HAMP domain-containing protein [Deltaproteobacteria bacterium]|nr:MAG: HAMP domain-containing protein [Deltaproteobacteria bacterium]